MEETIHCGGDHSLASAGVAERVDTSPGTAVFPCRRGRESTWLLNHLQYPHAVICTDGYTVEVKICSIPISFLLDTGAAVSFLRKHLWEKVNVDGKRSLQPWSMRRLIGVDGSPLDIRGCAAVDLVVAMKRSWPSISVWGYHRPQEQRTPH